MIAPQNAAPRFALEPGAVALPYGLLWLERSRALVAADAHFAYEELIGGVLPLWSTGESVRILRDAIARTGAAELIFLGDLVHGSRMSAGAARTVTAALDELRALVRVTIVAGNHEGPTGAAALLGETEDAVERDGWVLVHGDEPVAAHRCIIGHLHPSIALGGRESIPAFLASRRLIVVPALTPYSSGLNVLSSSCTQALRKFVEPGVPFQVVAAGPQRVYPFGALTSLCAALSRSR
jgi:uncharacterized protein